MLPTLRLIVLLATAALWASAGAWAQSGPLVLPQPGEAVSPAAKPVQRSKPKPKPIEAATDAASAAPASEGTGEAAPTAPKPAAKPKPKVAKPAPAAAAPASAEAPSGTEAPATADTPAPAPKPAAKPKPKVARPAPAAAPAPGAEAASSTEAPGEAVPAADAPPPAPKPAAKPKPKVARPVPAAAPAPGAEAASSTEAPGEAVPAADAPPPAPKPAAKPKPKVARPAAAPAPGAEAASSTEAPGEAAPAGDTPAPAPKPAAKPAKPKVAKPVPAPAPGPDTPAGAEAAAEATTPAPPSTAKPAVKPVRAAKPVPPPDPSAADATTADAVPQAQAGTKPPTKPDTRGKTPKGKAVAAAPKGPPEPVREVLPPLQGAALQDIELITDTRPLGRRLTPTLPPKTGENPTLVVTRSMGRSPRSLYLAETLSPPGLAVYDALLQAPDSSEAAPVALNSFEAIKGGAAAGPFRAGLVEENEAEPGRPRIDAGTTTWRYLQPDGGTGAPTAIVAEVVVDRPRLKVVMTFRPDRSPNAPSPLAIDIAFVNIQNPVTQIGIPELRNPGIERGIPLYGTLAGAMKPGEPFTIILSGNESDGEQNVKLLTGRPWIDIPMLTQNGKRLTLAFEKGTAVREMMRSAFRAWRLPWLP